MGYSKPTVDRWAYFGFQAIPFTGGFYMDFEDEDIAISTLHNYVRDKLSEVRKENHTALQNKLCSRLGISPDQLVYLLLQQYWLNYNQYLQSKLDEHKSSEINDRLKKALEEIRSSPEYNNYRVQKKLNSSGINSPVKKVNMLEVARLLKSGKTGKEVAELLHVSESTVTRRKQEIEEYGGLDKVIT